MKNEKHKVSRYESNFRRGGTRRSNAVEQINSGFAEKDMGLFIIPLQGVTVWKEMSEKRKHHKVENFKVEKPGGKGMALYYRLKNKDNNEHINLIFIFRDSFGMYMKIPRDSLSNPDFYLESLAKESYYVMIVEDHEDPYKFSDLIPMETVRKWNHWLSTARGNETRLVFGISLKNIYCRGLGQKNNPLFSGSTVLESFELLFN